MSTQSKVLNTQGLEKLQRVLGDGFVDFLQTHMDSADTLLQQMELAYQQQQQPPLERLAHNLKSVCFNIHATELADMARTLEQQIRNKGLPADTYQIQAMKAEYQRLLPVLQAYRNEAISAQQPMDQL